LFKKQLKYFSSNWKLYSAKLFDLLQNILSTKTLFNQAKQRARALEVL